MPTRKITVLARKLAEMILCLMANCVNWAVVPIAAWDGTCEIHVSWRQIQNCRIASLAEGSFSTNADLTLTRLELRYSFPGTARTAKHTNRPGSRHASNLHKLIRSAL
jgi:hypothetical protein